MFSKKFIASVFLAVFCVSPALATPTDASNMKRALDHATLRVRQITPDFALETFHPESDFETFGEGIEHPHSKRATFHFGDAGKAFAASKLGLDESAIKYHSGYEGEVSSHAFFRQTHEGVPFANAVANVAFNKDNKVVTFGSNFVKASNIPPSAPSVALEDAIKTAEATLNGKFNEHPPTLEYVALKDGSVALTHVVQIQDETTGAWYEAFVDAHENKVQTVTDFVAKASYRVLPITKEVLTEGFETLTNPQDLSASPAGWHSTDGTTNSTTTSGNNVISYKSSMTTGLTTQSSTGLNFIFTQNPSQAPTVAANLNAARTNNFYLVNTVHDITYKYGFTEAAFNFQQNNFGKGGTGNDRVTASIQDSAGTDNADFATPGDGQSGHMRMFLWDITNPERDGALENDIVVHENTHGVTNRMTGGGTGRCLQTTESGGMGEGWSDAMAEWTEHKDATVPDYVLGQYVVNDAAGIRSHPYSTSAMTNPLRYSSLKTLTEVHDIGEVWANILHNVYAALVSAHGFSATAHTDPTGTAGNVVFLHLFLDALPLQPCNPTFVTGRSAWIQADVNRYGGANKCILWNAFASRGLGVNAANHNDDTSVPSGC
ncbi:hypothetical protein PUNSTDRAFT_81599 [Punctularia strigosozonata HHB-11173 SS5]|uniref:uncharacterized protein n=1 Tax=Punctularia strigosozonata (strain HHB-11173) TaxID=741275 RepID=UPI0004418098|nr:uncharacterized protein PUNSTDRAFT_81599 [Punctularia strigosozonata HHB-11173 SS5]EIN12402.1 hypothetical protein PUNSTDRAFT_81599 [Punctularia strigosozonata HHB-11173 SS5]